LLLIENSGHVLDKNELIEKVWPDTFVEENRLADNISTLRKALGDDPKAPNFIRTVPGRGYRFVAEVREVSDETIALVDRRKTYIVIEEDDKAIPAALDQGRPAIALAVPSKPTVRRGLLTAILIAVVLILGASVVLAFYFRRRPPATSAPLINSIAVLPFKPLVAAERDESLELGMADTLITRLSRIGQFTVRPTNAVRRYNQLEDEAAKAGRELAVDAVLDGTIQKSGDRIRVSVRLFVPAGDRLSGRSSSTKIH
jgi:DNA-binding winged helix-turn-helix (wHTH) protein/TolB-like protein